MLTSRYDCSCSTPVYSFADHEVVCGGLLENLRRSMQALGDTDGCWIPVIGLRIRRWLWRLCRVDTKEPSFPIPCSSRPRKVVLIPLSWRRAHQVQNQGFGQVHRSSSGDGRLSTLIQATRGLWPCFESLKMPASQKELVRHSSPSCCRRILMRA